MIEVTLKWGLLILTAAVKFAFAFPFIFYSDDLNLVESLLAISIGGTIGIVFFCNLWYYTFKGWNILIHIPTVEQFIYKKIYPFLRLKPPKKKRKKIFTKRARKIVKLKNEYGLIGLAFLTPVLISIPIGTFFAVRFYGRTHRTLSYLFISILIWSIIISVLAVKFRVIKG